MGPADLILEMRTCAGTGTRKESRAAGRWLGQPEDISNTDRLQIHALLRPSVPTYPRNEGSHQITASAWASLGTSHGCPHRDVVILF